MDSCDMRNSFENALRLKTDACPANLSNYCEKWEEGYMRSSRDMRIWSRAKDLICGYAVIWTFMFASRLYFFFKKTSPKQLLWRLRHISLRSLHVFHGNLAQAASIKKYCDCSCPVCLASPEELRKRMAVVGLCGHALCAECFVTMWSHGKLLLFPINCPLCMMPVFRVTPAFVENDDLTKDHPDASSLDKCIRRYNIIFAGDRAGLLKPDNSERFWISCTDIAGTVLRIGYFFVMFDRKMLNTISFFLLHLFIAIVVEYFENVYFQNLLDEI